MKEKAKLQFTEVQIGVIVKDMDKAIAFYESLGIKPFKPLSVTPTNRIIYGKPAKHVINKTKSAWIGNVEFELIEPVKGDSPPMRYLEEKGDGISHIAFHVEDYKKEVQKIIDEGFNVISSGSYLEVKEGGYAYFDTDILGGVQLELAKQK